MTNIAVTGAGGRMANAIVAELSRSDELTLAAAIARPGNPVVGRDAGRVAGCPDTGILVTTNIGQSCFDVMLDFTQPQALEKNLEICTKLSSAILVGTTGLDQSHNQLLSRAAEKIPVLYAANTSVGINLCLSLVETTARTLGEAVDIEVIEAHHRNKQDAPSGTALALGEAAAQARETDLASSGIFSREGMIGERPRGSIGFNAIRGGNIAGEHTVMFIGENERIEISHRVTDRKIFAQGALQGACWLSTQPKGLYSMQDVLDLR